MSDETANNFIIIFAIISLAFLMGVHSVRVGWI